MNRELSTIEVAALLNKSRKTVWQYIKSKTLPAHFKGRDLFVYEKDLQLVADIKIGRPRKTKE